MMENFTEMYSTEYDHKLKTIRHFDLHPELLPYVGLHYNHLRILLIGESHYMDANVDKSSFLEWYDKSTDEIFSTFAGEDQKYRSWFNTREVLTNFLCHRRSKAHRMFSNPANVIKEVLEESGQVCPTDSAAFQCAAFFNYFQRPNLTKGGSFSPITGMDEEKRAQAITKEIIRILDPAVVVFLSKKAYRAFGQEKIGNITVESANHPTSSWWYREGGEDHFKDIMRTVNQGDHGLLNLPDERIELMKKLFNEIAEALRQEGFEMIDSPNNDIDKYYNEDSTEVRPKLSFHKDDVNLTVEIDYKIYFYFTVKGWKYLLWCESRESWDQSRRASRKDTPDFKNLNDQKGNYGTLFYDEKRKKYIDDWVAYILETLNGQKV